MIGGGLIGLEVASSARRLGASVTVVEAAPLPLRGLLGAEVGLRLAAWHREDGTDLRLGAALQSARGGESATERRIDEETLAAGAAARRVEELVLPTARASRRTTSSWPSASGPRPSGCRVRSLTGLPHVFAAGDVTGSGHWEAAARQGAGVARALLGLDPQPPAPPSFWSDQLGLRLQCVGTPAGAHATIASDPEGRGFEAVYRRDGRVTAVLLAGRSAADLRAARRLLAPEPQLERSAA